MYSFGGNRNSLSLESGESNQSVRNCEYRSEAGLKIRELQRVWFKVTLPLDHSLWGEKKKRNKMKRQKKTLQPRMES